MKTLLLRSAAIAALAIPAAAHAQSTGSVDFEEGQIVVTGGWQESIGGFEVPNTPKAKQVMDDEAIRAQRPGQTVNDIINMIPGVSFQNNDPWGSSGGGFYIRGFGADRVSQTVDGVPLNDSGNYALYTNQMVDSEVLESVSVSLGSTDVDSPTASASGGTINVRTRAPADDFKLTATMTYGNTLAEGSGDKPYMRVFGMVDTGDFTGVGTKAFFSASYTNYDTPYNNYGKIDKTQFNGRIWQDIGDNGDFIAIAGHYNENRNNFAGSVDFDELRQAIADGDGTYRFYEIDYPCEIPSGQLGGGQGMGVAGESERYDDRNGCGAVFERRYNPSNTGNIRGTSRFTLADGLVLTVDPSYQYVKANGGGPDDLREAFYEVTVGEGEGEQTQLYTGAFSGGYYFGRDLNGDGDLLDRVAGNDPSQTRTHRFGVIANLAYEINPDHRVRLNYTWERANHRQTGQTGFMFPNGEPQDVFPINDPILTSDGFALNKRNRQSYAILHQVSGEYRGVFGPLTALIGLRAPFFTRELNQYCYTTSASGYVNCFENQSAALYEAANPDHVPPLSRTYKYDKLLPNVGFTLDLTDSLSGFGSYSKGLSVPGTDPLYDSLYVAGVQPTPETTDSFDLGLRFRTGRVEAQLSGWYTKYSDRLATAYDPTANDGQGETVYRNLGQVDKYGIDASLAFRPTDNTMLYVFGSINESEIKDNVQIDTDGDGNPVYAMTAGMNESGAPTSTFGARAQGDFGPIRLGAQVKNTGKRWLNDENTDSLGSYTTVDLDVRWDIAEFPTGGNVALQFNLTNLFDELYIGYVSTDLQGTPSFIQIGAPRAASVSLIVGY